MSTCSEPVASDWVLLEFRVAGRVTLHRHHAPRIPQDLLVIMTENVLEGAIELSVHTVKYLLHVVS